MLSKLTVCTFVATIPSSEVIGSHTVYSSHHGGMNVAFRTINAY